MDLECIEIFGWMSIGHVSIVHEPFTALEQWKAFRYRLLWAIAPSKWTAPEIFPYHHYNLSFVFH